MSQSPPPATGLPSVPVPPSQPVDATPSASQPTDGAAELATLLDEPKPRIWYRRPTVLAVAGLAVLLAVLVPWWLVRRAAAAAPHYSTQPVARGDLTLYVTATGTIQPTRSINIGSELSGTVLKVNVDVNDAVKKGQVLLVLDPAKLQDQILRSTATLAAARAKRTQTTATITEATAALGRLLEVAKLSGGKVPSLAELDTGRAMLDRAVADDNSALAGINDSEAALSTDRINLSKASISSPADGVVLTRNVDPGNAVAASLQAVTLFTVAEDLSHLRLWVYVDEADVGGVKLGQQATFTVSAYVNKPFPAVVTRVGFGSTITDNVVTYLTYLDVDNADLRLRPGMTATATITSQSRKDVLLVPNSALRFAPATAPASQPAKGGMLASLAPRMPGNRTRQSGTAGTSTSAARAVWVLRAGVAAQVAVVPGISDGHMTEITAGELTAGMLVITDQKTLAPK